jgi:hypothetical protein
VKGGAPDFRRDLNIAVDRVRYNEDIARRLLMAPEAPASAVRAGRLQFQGTELPVTRR